MVFWVVVKTRGNMVLWNTGILSHHDKRPWLRSAHYVQVEVFWVV